MIRQFNSNTIKKLCLLLVLFLTINCEIKLHAQDYGDFPYFESFLKKTSLPTGVIKPTPGRNVLNRARLLNNGLQLTPDSLDCFGAVYLDNHWFKAENGIFIEFEYMIYGGTGGDGFSVFFFDAAEANPGIGASGAGIGYGYNRSIYNAQFRHERAPGLKSAYLGIAFDTFGNFKGLRYQGESRVSGIPFSYGTTGSGETSGGNGDNDITLRGAMRKTPIRAGGYEETGDTIPGLGVQYSGYPVLVTQRTTDNVGFRLKTESNFAWERHDQSKAKTGFGIRGNTNFENSQEQGYRKAFIEMFPNGKQNGFFVSVMIQHDSTRDTLIYDYEYINEFDYLENAIFDAQGDYNTGDQPRSVSLVRKLKFDLPIELKIGLAAATGSSEASPIGKKDKHIIKNLGITLPRAAEAYDDYIDDKVQGTRLVNFNPLLNDVGYKGTISRNQDPCPECIDGTTFQFVDENGQALPDPHESIIANEGKWTYDVNTETVTFEPVPSFLGPARVRYSIKGGKVDSVPYADNAYRSTPATIGVDIVVNPNPPRKLITNKMVTGKVR